eukprot:1094538-Pleurochrysis_carterae.AAC.2
MHEATEGPPSAHVPRLQATLSPVPIIAAYAGNFHLACLRPSLFSRSSSRDQGCNLAVVCMANARTCSLAMRSVEFLCLAQLYSTRASAFCPLRLGLCRYRAAAPRRPSACSPQARHAHRDADDFLSTSNSTNMILLSYSAPRRAHASGA